MFIRERHLALDCFAVFSLSELTEEAGNVGNDAITLSLLHHYGYDCAERITDHVNMTVLFCVDRVTPAFQKLMNGNIRQGFKNSRLPIGISFGSNTVYIARQKDGYAIMEYKRLRKEFLAAMDLPAENVKNKKVKGS